MGLKSCIQTALNGDIILEIEVQPGSSRQGVVGVNKWRNKIQVAVKAEARKGRANNAVFHVLSKLFKTEVEVVSGKTTRNKKIRIVGRSPQEVISVLEGLVES